MALYTPEERDETARRLIDLLSADDRIERVELAGSGASGYADRWSDVDLYVTVADGVDQQKVADSWTARAYELLPVVHHYAVAFGEHHMRGFLLERRVRPELADRLEPRLLSFLDEAA